jgi:hypothetical protein
MPLTGAVLTAQTAGEGLVYNSHIHGIVLNGYYGENGEFVDLGGHEAGEVDDLSGYFCNQVLKDLVKEDLLEEEVSLSILEQEHSGFSVWIGDTIAPEDEERIKFLSRYIERAPISLKKLSLEGGMVRVHSSNDAVPDSVVSPLEFLAMLSLQIPNRSESLVRYYGTLSYRYRGERLKQEQAERQGTDNDAQQYCSVTDFEPKKKSSATWAMCIRKIYEVDALECPRCGGRMSFKAAIIDETEVERIAKHLGYKEYHPPPPILELSLAITEVDMSYIH